MFSYVDIDGCIPATYPYKKVQYADSKLRHLTPVLSEKRKCLVVNVDSTEASGHAERDAAEKLARRWLKLAPH